MHKIVFTIECEWDDEAKVWYVSNSNVPGLVAEAASVEDMQALLVKRVPELVQLNMPDLVNWPGREVPMELLLKQHSNIRIAC